MFAARRLVTNLPRARPQAALFHSTAPAFVQKGDPIPSLDLGKGVIIGVPAAFSPACSSSHIPGYINHPKLKEAGQVFVVAVNDPFHQGLGCLLDPTGKSGVRFLGDPSGEFTKALDLSFDSSAIFGNDRSKRYALLVENGKVKQAFVEPDNIGLNVSAAEKVLG
ncbi:Redoxin [Penicillium maclennaniae]|uniref:Redoxin n=1 Tax=Penicillium maclennaniae TaxID=1343394 RepID=UPI002541C6D7|nr:Redoxin [Penicillium maclennaniae]KAJ5662429.1 Redoxin [Penicillium maclennaniae]